MCATAVYLVLVSSLPSSISYPHSEYQAYQVIQMDRWTALELCASPGILAVYSDV